MAEVSTPQEKIGIIGSGLIGRSYAMLFAEAGFRVSIFDVDHLQCEKALEIMQQQFQDLEKNNLKKRSTTSKEDCENISIATDMRECIDGAIYVQECVPEVLELKKKIHREIDEIVEDDVIIATSTSFIVPSLIFEGLTHNSHALVTHPTNPPYFAPFVEIVPSRWTEKSVVIKTKKLLLSIGLSPVVLNKEIPGFALNRVQVAIFMASWQLVQENVMSVEDVDKIMTDGLGLRYAFIGPWENAHLNNEGLEKYLGVYAESIYGIQQSFKPEKMEGEAVKVMEQELCKRVPLDQLEERRKWRDDALSRLSVLKRDMIKKGKTD